MNNFQKQQSERILSMYGIESNDLIKGGEGSKGGKVIGHTKSGKPIYDVKGHKSYKDFSMDDHLDASYKHGEQEDKHHKEFWKERERLGLKPGQFHNETHTSLQKHAEERDKYSDLRGYHHKKFKAIQNGTSSYTEGSIRENRGMNGLSHR